MNTSKKKVLWMWRILGDRRCAGEGLRWGGSVWGSPLWQSSFLCGQRTAFCHGTDCFSVLIKARLHGWTADWSFQLHWAAALGRSILSCSDQCRPPPLPLSPLLIVWTPASLRRQPLTMRLQIYPEHFQNPRGRTRKYLDIENTWLFLKLKTNKV